MRSKTNERGRSRFNVSYLFADDLQRDAEFSTSMYLKDGSLAKIHFSPFKYNHRSAFSYVPVPHVASEYQDLSALVLFFYPVHGIELVKTAFHKAKNFLSADPALFHSLQLFLVVVEPANNLNAELLENARNFAKENNMVFDVCHYFGNYLRSLGNNPAFRSAACSSGKGLTVQRLHNAFVSAEKEYYHSFGFFDYLGKGFRSAEAVCKDRFPVLTTDTYAEQALVQLLEGEGELNWKSLKFLVLEALYPGFKKSEVAEGAVLENFVTGLIAHLRKESEHKKMMITFILCMKETNFLPELYGIIIDNLLSLPSQVPESSDIHSLSYINSR